ncbi:MAG: SpoIIE family protein phosphatase [bacterium]|nr:SpoIIE family protein phosphatase [bacterium]
MRYKKHFITAITCVCILLFPWIGRSAGNTGEIIPAAKNGILDLSSHSLKDLGAIKLNGEWEFYWEQLLTPEDFTAENLPPKTGLINLPGPWKNYIVDEKELPGEGYATFRLIIHLKERENPGSNDPLSPDNRDWQQLAIHVKIISSAFTMYANGKTICSVGTVGKDYQAEVPYYLPHVITFPRQGNRVEIILTVSNFNHRVGGARHTTLFGRETDVNKSWRKKIASEHFLFGSIIIIALYHLGFFLIRRKNMTPLYFGSFCFLIALRLILTGERYFLHLFPWAGWEFMYKLEYLCNYIGLPVFTMFLYSLFPKEFYKPILRVILASGIILSLIVIFSRIGIYSYTIQIYQVILILTCLYGFYILIKALRHKRAGAGILLFGCSVLFCSILNDILYNNHIIHTIEVLSFGLFIFILSQAYLLSSIFSRAFYSVESLSKELSGLNIQLENKVKERTLELEKEKKIIEEQNKIFRREMIMARSIQQQIIEPKKPADYIYTLYKPMDLVGGDYYDFITFEDSRKIGIFLSDVSGHGVPAALITSMIKSFILQSGGNNSNPAKLLLYLNQLLLNQTGGNFVTAIYCIFDPTTRSITYSNAGHNPPYLVLKNQVTMLDKCKSIPLGIAENIDLFQLKKPYENYTEILPPNSKLVLYTDGLVEATNDSDKNNYFEFTIETVFKELQALSAEDFVTSLFKKLLLFTNTEDLDDDVCVICLDIQNR